MSCVECISETPCDSSHSSWIHKPEAYLGIHGTNVEKQQSLFAPDIPSKGIIINMSNQERLECSAWSAVSEQHQVMYVERHVMELSEEAEGARRVSWYRQSMVCTQKRIRLLRNPDRIVRLTPLWKTKSHTRCPFVVNGVDHILYSQSAVSVKFEQSWGMRNAYLPGKQCYLCRI